MMIRLLACAALASAALGLSACSTTTTAQVLNNLSADCERHYDGTIGASMAGGQFQGTVKIDCAPKATTAPAATIAPAAATTPAA